MQKGKNRKNNYCYFNNISDFTDYLNSNSNKPWMSTADNTERRTEWCGGLSYKESYRRLILGDSEIANNINKVKEFKKIPLFFLLVPNSNVNTIFSVFGLAGTISRQIREPKSTPWHNFLLNADYSCVLPCTVILFYRRQLRPL